MKQYSRQLCSALIAVIGACSTTAAIAAKPQQAVGLVAVVQQSTQQYRDESMAAGGGYDNLGTCVSGEAGAMGIHYANFGLVTDGTLDAANPEILVYEPTYGGGKRLVAAEYIVFADAWDGAHPGQPPALIGQHFDYLPSPNRYGLPASYVLHVWAWKSNPNGMFANFNPRVTCEYYEGG